MIVVTGIAGMITTAMTVEIPAEMIEEIDVIAWTAGIARSSGDRDRPRGSGDPSHDSGG